MAGVQTSVVNDGCLSPTLGNLESRQVPNSVTGVTHDLKYPDQNDLTNALDFGTPSQFRPQIGYPTTEDSDLA